MDHARKSLESITNSLDYELVRDIVIFDEHSEFDDAGKLVRRFDKEKLGKIVHKCNERMRKTGDLSPIGPGHTSSKAPELLQPPIFGYAADMYIGTYGPENKLGIKAKFYMKRQVEIPDPAKPGQIKTISGREALKEFPRRSIELWYGDDLIDWVALLKRTPERDLGLTAYQKNLPWSEGPKYYSSQEKTTPLACAYDGKKLRYSMDEMMADPTDQPDSNKPDVDHDELAGDELKQAEKYWTHYMKVKKGFQKMCSKYEAEESEETNPVETPDQNAAGMPGPGNAGMPGGGGGENALERFAKAGEPDKYGLASSAHEATKSAHSLSSPLMSDKQGIHSMAFSSSREKKHDLAASQHHIAAMHHHGMAHTLGAAHKEHSAHIAAAESHSNAHSAHMGAHWGKDTSNYAKEKEVLKMSKETPKETPQGALPITDGQYDSLKKSLDELKSENETLKADLARRDRKELYSKELHSLEDKVEFDMDEEIAEVIDLDAEQFKKHKEKMLKRYAKRADDSDPTSYARVRTADMPEPEHDFTERDLDKVLPSIRQGKSWNDAVTAYQKK